MLTMDAQNNVVMTRLDDDLKNRMHSKAVRMRMSDAAYLRYLIERDTRERPVKAAAPAAPAKKTTAKKTVPVKRIPAKKTVASKPPAKKTPAKKTTAKKITPTVAAQIEKAITEPGTRVKRARPVKRTGEDTP